MQKRVTGPEIEKLIQLLARVPGLGPRSARRAALHLIKKKDQLMGPLAAGDERGLEKVTVCSVCGNVDTADPCTICTDPTTRRGDDHRRRGRRRSLGAGAGRRDERAATTCSAARCRRSTASARMTSTSRRSSTASPTGGVGEIIIAVNATVEGQTTAHYITDQLAGLDVKITRLAHGVPVGGELDYLDEGTLSAALRSRTAF